MKKQIKIEESKGPMEQHINEAREMRNGARETNNEAGEMRIQFHDETVRGRRSRLSVWAAAAAMPSIA